MQMDSRIILAGQQPNFMALIDEANRARQFQTDATHENAFKTMLQQNGTGILHGDQNALAALAGFDPQAALGVQQTHQSMKFDAEKFRMAAEQHALSVDAATLAQQKAEMESELRGLATFHARGDRAGYDRFVASKGLDPAEYAFDNFPAVAAQAETVLEVWNGFRPEVPKPLSTPGKLQADFDAGLIPKSAYDAGVAAIGSPTTVVNAGGGSDKQVFDAMNESAVSARSAAVGLNSLLLAGEAVKSGIISGFAADQRLALQKAAALLGVGDTETIQNTETFRAQIAPQVAAIMKATVGSTQISNADREFAERAAGGSIALDAASIKRLLDVMEKAARAAIELHGERLNNVYPEGKGYDRERALFGVVLPPLASGPVGQAAPTAALPPPVTAAPSSGVDWTNLPPDLRGVAEKYAD